MSSFLAINDSLWDQRVCCGIKTTEFPILQEHHPKASPETAKETSLKAPPEISPKRYFPKASPEEIPSKGIP
jgi:hypothetical protein